MVKKFKDYGKSYSIIYDIITSHRNYIEEANSLISFLSPYLKEKKIISVGCGTGNHEIIIANRGFKIFGIDNSPEMIKVANTKKIIGILEFGSNFNEASKFFSLNKHSCIISLGNCINCLLDEASLTKFITKIYSNLSKKGCFFFEAWNGEECLANPPTIVSRNYNSDNYEISRVAIPKIFYEKKEVEIEYKISGYIQKSQLNVISKHKLKLFTAETIINILKKVGFLDIKVLPSLSNFLPIDKTKPNRMLAFCATC